MRLLARGQGLSLLGDARGAGGDARRAARARPADALRRPLARPRPERGARGRAARGPAARRRRPARPRSTDLVQGEIEVANEQLDDMVLLRGDGTPTYMLSVVVDDIDMGITHVIRGHDHLTNTFRQIQLYRAIGAEPPRFAHIPLIHGPDGAKLSKRHGALSVTEYREMGFLPEAVRNYLLRLGWGHGDEEIISHRAGDRAVRPRRGRSVAGAFRPRQAHQPQRPLSARAARRRNWSS